jgi:ABC-type transport system involved in cytochrome bd biosynthesis fused ATPase/permease subunit
VAKKLDLRIDTSVVSTLKEVCGSAVEAFNQDLLSSLLRTAWLPNGLLDAAHQQNLTAMIVALTAFKVTDEVEAMLAAQAIAQHNASMESARRAMLPDQPHEISQGLRKGAANSSRAFVELLDALDRRRGKGAHQTLRIERVQIAPGGHAAIVGTVQADAPVAQALPPVLRPVPLPRKHPLPRWPTSSACGRNW